MRILNVIDYLKFFFEKNGTVLFLFFLVGLVILIRFLRKKYEWVDWIAYGIVIIGSIVTWISSGFWSALLFFIISAIIVGIVFGRSTVVKHGNTTWHIDCSKCGYDKVEVIQDEGDHILVRCPRCGTEEWHKLNH